MLEELTVIFALFFGRYKGLTFVLQIISQLWRDESGSTAVEYALLLGVLGVGSLAGIVGATERIVSAFNTHETVPMIAMADQPDVTRTH